MAVLALELLYDAVKARFAIDAPTVEMPFGWREPARQQQTISRIVWLPGDEAGNAGVDAPPRWPGRLEPGRPLATLLESFTCVITAHVPATVGDRTAHLNELAQWRATRLLYDDWRRAVYLAAHGTVAIKSVRWDVTHNERRSGACLIAVGTIESMVPDELLPTVPADAHADITQTELDVSEFQVVYASDD